MATVANATSYLDDENKRKTASNRNISTSYNGSGSIGGTAQSGGISGAQPKPSASGSYTNFNEYADLNQDQAGVIGEQVASGLNNEYTNWSGKIKDRVSSIATNPLSSDYSAYLSSINKDIGDLKNYGKQYQNSNNASKFIKSKTPGQGLLNEFLIGSQSAQNAINENVVDFNNIDNDVKGAASTSAGSILTDSMDEYNDKLTNRDNVVNKYKEDFGNLAWINSETIARLAQEYLGLQDQQAAEDADLPNWVNWMNNKRHREERKKADDAINSAQETYKSGSWNTQLDDDPEFQDYNFNQSTDLTTEQRAALEALSSLGGEYKLDDTDYNISYIPSEDVKEDIRNVRRYYY